MPEKVRRDGPAAARARSNTLQNVRNARQNALMARELETAASEADPG